MTEKELKGLGDEIEKYGFTSAKTGTALFLAVNHLRALLKSTQEPLGFIACRFDLVELIDAALGVENQSEV